MKKDRHKKKTGIIEETFADFKARDFFIFIMLVFIIGIIPLIVRYVKLPTNPDELQLIKSINFDEGSDDLFAYYKSGCLIAAAVLLCFFYIYRYFTSNMSFKWKTAVKNPVVIAFGIYIFTAVLSVALSQFKHTSIYGISQRYEGIFALLTYMVIFYAVFDFVKSRFRAKLVLCILLTSSFIISLIGLSQFFGRDVFAGYYTNTELAKGFPQGLLAPFVLGGTEPDSTMSYYNIVKEYGGDLAPAFKDIYATLYNPNCAGLYAAMLASLFLFTGLYWPKGKKFKYVLLSMSALLCFIMVGAKSSGGLLGFAVAIVIGLVLSIVHFLRRQANANPTSETGYASMTAKGLGFAAAIICAAVIILFVPPVRNNLETMVYKFYAYTNPENTFFLQDLRIEDQTVEIETKSGSLTIDSSRGIGDLVFYDPDGSPLTYIETAMPDRQNPVDYYKSSAFGDVLVQRILNKASIQFSGEIFLFSVDENNRITALNNRDKPVDISMEVPSIGFEGYELFASGRGYIWSRSLPLVFDNLVLGSGPDTYALAFPQNDIVGKLRYLGNPYITVDKPHNYYLQVCVNTGLVSLLALLFIFAAYVFRTIFSLIKAPDENFGLRLGLLAGICSYLVSSLATDSTVSVSPVFWAILGLGYGVEALSKKAGGL